MSNYLDRSPRRSIVGPALLVGGGLAAIGAIWFAVKKSNQTVDNVNKALAGTDPPATVQPPTEGTGGMVNLRLTGYWPFAAGASERAMEGGVFDRKMNDAYKNKPESQVYKDHVLHTVEQHLANPIAHPFVSLSGDDALWPYGQKVLIPWTDGRTIVGRVVDTGSHFRGVNKVYRVAGYEPLDVCVASSKTIVPKQVLAKIVPFDNFDKGKLVATSGFKGQTVMSGFEGKSPADFEMLARAVYSELLEGYR